MWKLNDEQIKRIQSYHEDFSNNEIARDMGINRKTVAKYRASVQQEASDVLSGKEEAMLFRKEAEKLNQLSREEKTKLSLMERYSDKDIKEMLDYIARTKKREIDEVLWTPWHLKFALLADTHIWAKACDLDALHRFYEDAKAEWVECFVHCWDLVDWCWVYRWQQFEQSEKGFDEQVEKVVKDYPNVWLPTYFIWGNHDESYLKNSWADITRVIDSLRDDLVNLGYYDWLLNINWITIQIQHGGGGNSYSKDYKLQRYIDSIEAGQEPDIFGLWHYHQAIHTLQRWIHGFMPWAFLKKNLLAKRFRFPNVIGWWIIDITKDECGRKRLVATFLNE